MTDYLLDTNVVSELMKARPDPVAVEWLRRTPNSFLSVLTVAELERGVYLLERRDPARAERIGSWLMQLQHNYADRILEVDLAVASNWATLPVTRTLPVIDSMLAATAITHKLIIATRNVRDFADTGVKVHNPFAGED